MVRFEGVTRRYGDVIAVDCVSLDIAAGEFFALLGPSGCGKTTLLRLAAGFEHPDAGRVLIDGEDMTGVPPYRRPVNMMFQSYALFPHLTVAGNIAFGLRQEKMPRKAIDSRVDELMSLVRLEGLGGRRPHQLSGGQRQRVALARALAKRPKVLLLDEPLAALDKKLRDETQFELTKLQEQLGTTFVIVTHDQQEAMTVAHRMAVMDRGRLAQVATPAEIYEQPASRWVADFIGDVNLIEGVVEAIDAGLATLAADGLRLRAPAPDNVVTGRRAVLALRPERIRIAMAPQPDGVAGTVKDIGYRGDSVLYRVALASGAELKVSVAHRTRLADLPVGRGDRIFLAWPPDAGVLLTQ